MVCAGPAWKNKSAPGNGRHSRKSERATTTPGQIVLTPEQRAAWVKKLYGEAVGKGVINPAFIAANTNLMALAAQIPPSSSETEKGATYLVKGLPEARPKSSKAAAASGHAQAAAPADPKELLLLASIPITDNDFAALAADRAKAVRAYILATGKVEAGRLFLTENKTGGVKVRRQPGLPAVPVGAILDCAGRAQRRQRFWETDQVAGCNQSGVALRLPPQCMFLFPLSSK